MGGGVSVALEKVLPVASGIGGGSADAAAVLRAMARMGRPLSPPAEVLALGADVPVCLSGRAVRMAGVGEVLSPIALPKAWLVLANPGVAVPTAQVFRALTRRDNPPMPALPRLRSVAELAAFLAMHRNDLELAATTLPMIAEGSRRPDCAVWLPDGADVGVGSTCFGLFADGLAASAAMRVVAEAQPGWWLAAGRMLS